MKQGEIWNANLNPTEGSEQAGLRPVLIISGNLLNENVPLVICCPITSKIKNYHGNVILIPDSINGLELKSEILTFHIRSISKNRLKNKIGKVNNKQLQQVKTCLNDLLRY
jgi:mRNA interferase MazF